METEQNSVSARPTLFQEVTEWLANFPDQFAEAWLLLPNKAFFFALLGAWLLFFQFLGNATFGYVNTTSLMYWMYNAYNNEQSDGQDAHGNVIPFVVLGLFWWKRKELLGLNNRIWWPGLLLLATALMLHLLGFMVQQPRISIVAMFAGIYALMGLAWGPGWLRASFFPFFLLAFCIPITSIGEPITFPLRNFVAKVVGIICNNILGLSVIREGTQLFNAAHTYGYEVAAACSGLRSLVAIFALSTIYSFLSFDKGWKRVLIILAAFPLAIIGNVMRMLGIILTAEVSGQAAGNYVHESAIFSILPYIPAIFGVMFLGKLLREDESPTITLTAKPV